MRRYLVSKMGAIATRKDILTTRPTAISILPLVLPTIMEVTTLTLEMINMQFVKYRLPKCTVANFIILLDL